MREASFGGGEVVGVVSLVFIHGMRLVPRTRRQRIIISPYSLFFPFSIIFLSTSSTFQVKLAISSSQKRIKPIPRRIQNLNPSIAKIFRDYFLRRIVFVLSPTRDLRNTSSQFHTDPVPPSRYPGPLNAADKEQSTLIKTMPTRG